MDDARGRRSGSEPLPIVGSPGSPGSPLTYLPTTQMEPLMQPSGQRDFALGGSRHGGQDYSMMGEWPNQPKLVPTVITCEQSSHLPPIPLSLIFSHVLGKTAKMTWKESWGEEMFGGHNLRTAQSKLVKAITASGRIVAVFAELGQKLKL